MAVCSFFSSKQSHKADRILIQKGLIYLIEQKGVDLFYLREKSEFEKIAIEELSALQKQYSYIGYATVLDKAPPPTLGHSDYSNTICLPCYAFPSYAKRNVDYWLISRSDFVLTFMPNLRGSAAYFKRFLEKRNIELINLADDLLKETLKKID